MKNILIDTSSAILLYKVDLFSMIMEHYRVITAEAVFEELTQNDYPDAEFFQKSLFMQRQTIQYNHNGNLLNQHLYHDLISLGKGERETIYLYQEGNAEFVVIDDYKGARYCKDHSIPYTNALLIPRVLWMAKKLDSSAYHEKTDYLLQQGRYSKHIIDYALHCTQQDLQYFLP